jgi:hypothetical protein
VLALGGCGARSPTSGEGLEAASPGHVHSIAAAADGSVYLATHNGLFAAPAGERALKRRGGDGLHLKALAIDGEGRLIASGHARAGQDLPADLGLMRSPDEGGTWRPVALHGEADLHVVRGERSRLYAFDARVSRLIVSGDGEAGWQSRGATPTLFDLAVDPERADRLVAATQRGLYMSTSGGQRWQRVSAPSARVLAWLDDGQLLALDAGGTVHRTNRSLDAWQQVGDIGQRPVASTTADGRLFVVTEDAAIMMSRDGGATWKVRAS